MQSVGTDYEFGSDLIGHGAFAIVYKGRQKSTNEPVAVKQILLKNIPGKLSNMRQKEIAILKGLKHANIVQLFDCYETKLELYIVMEFCNGGDLADHLHVKKSLSEDSIRHLALQVASALSFLHKHHIIHRDIKPQNILLTYAPNSNKQSFKNSVIKIADFGFARHLSGQDMAATICGSPLYMAPEILIGHKYDGKVDMWSTGVILYQCVTGKTPFTANDTHSLRMQYIRSPLVPRIPAGISSVLTDLLVKLIKKSPQDRIGPVEFKSHPFLNNRGTSEEVLSINDSPSLHAKSSPVPITRPTVSHSPNSSPVSGSLSYGSTKGCSGSSGPPSIHRILNSTSVHKYYQTPPTNVTDEGFILVGAPGVHSRGSGSSPEVGIMGTSPRTVPSPHGSLPRQSSLRNVFPMSESPQSSDYKSAILSDTPPFMSLFRTSGKTNSHYGTPPGCSPGSSPALSKSPTQSMSPAVPRSLPSSRPGSHTKLSTLVESDHEEVDSTSCDNVLDSMNLVTPSLLMKSDTLRDELERMSDTGQASFTNVFGLTMDVSEPKRGGKDGLERRPSKTMNLSEELADIRRKGLTLSQKQTNVFQIGNDSSDEQDLSPVGGVSRREGIFDMNSSSSCESPTTEEVFSLDEDANSPLYTLQQHISLAKELLRIAKTRQGPMLLLSSSLGDSGGMVDHAVRFSEQLVLCTKASTVIRDGIRQYHIAVATLDSSDNHRTVLADAEDLQVQCMNRARTAKELYHKCLAKRKRHSIPLMNVNAEKLIFYQAVDMCKQTLLEEKNLRRDECFKKYGLAYVLMKLLHSDAKTENDRVIIQKYIRLIKCRKQALMSRHQE